MIAAGVALLVGGAVVAGIWLAFLGCFLNAAAAAEAQQLIARETLGDLRVRDLMVTEPVTVTPETTIDEFVDEVAWQHRHPTYPVVADSRPLGLLLFRCIAEIPRQEWKTRTVRDRMLPREQVPLVREQDRAADVLAQLAGAPGRALVVDHGRLAGLISITDIARACGPGRSRAGARDRTAGGRAGSDDHRRRSSRPRASQGAGNRRRGTHVVQ